MIGVFITSKHSNFQDNCWIFLISLLWYPTTCPGSSNIDFISVLSIGVFFIICAKNTCANFPRSDFCCRHLFLFLRSVNFLIHLSQKVKKNMGYA